MHRNMLPLAFMDSLFSQFHLSQYYVIYYYGVFCLVLSFAGYQSSSLTSFLCFFAFVFLILTEGAALCHLCSLMKPTTNFPGQLGCFFWSRPCSLDQDLVNTNYNRRGQTVDGEVKTDLAEANLSAHRREYRWETNWFTQQNTVKP